MNSGLRKSTSSSLSSSAQPQLQCCSGSDDGLDANRLIGSEISEQAVNGRVEPCTRVRPSLPDRRAGSPARVLRRSAPVSDQFEYDSNNIQEATWLVFPLLVIAAEGGTTPPEGASSNGMATSFLLIKRQYN